MTRTLKKLPRTDTQHRVRQLIAFKAGAKLLVLNHISEYADAELLLSKQKVFKNTIGRRLLELDLQLQKTMEAFLNSLN
jgi:uncharacterized protein YukJ